jgi:hypothetical protein
LLDLIQAAVILGFRLIITPSSPPHVPMAVRARHSEGGVLLEARCEVRSMNPRHASCKGRTMLCVLRTCDDVSPSHSDLAPGVRRHGDMCREDVAAVVNAANERLSHGGGIAKAIAEQAGCDGVVQKESAEWVQKNGMRA